MAIMHLPDVSGPSRSLENELEWLADQGQLEVLVPGHGPLSTFGQERRTNPFVADAVLARMAL